MKAKNGKLKIFLGYAAGVGKTYTMLETAQDLKRDGVDVVAGYIEPHQRPDTLKMLADIEVLDVLEVDYKGIILREFDLELALKRNPEVILVDELAHTNAPGVRHKKRYQDIEELLRQGIDVYTTVNIQHIESLNDLVESITGVQVNERVPDSVLDRAESVELIDIDPSELIDRLNRGKIYKETQAKRALENFFTETKLVSLREIALRKTADKINRDADYDYAYQNADYFTQEHLLVCISASPLSEKVIRTAARMADAFHAQLTGIYIEGDDEDPEDQVNIAKNIKLAEDLGAQITTLFGDDIAIQIAEYARISHVSKIVIGRPARKRGLFQTNIIDQLSDNAPNIDVYVIPDQKAQYYEKRKAIFDVKSVRWQDGLIAIGILMLATLVGSVFSFLGFSEANVITVFILGVLFTSLLTVGKLWSILASIMSVLVFNFFFTAPRYTLSAYDTGYPVTFLIMFTAAILTSSLTSRVKSSDAESVKKTYRTEILLETSLKLQQATTRESIIFEIGMQVRKLVNRNVIVYTYEETMLVPMIFSQDSPEYIHDTLLSSEERAIADWVYQNNKRAGAGTNTLAGAKCLYLAVRSVDAVVAVLAIELEEPLDIFEKNLLVSIINECGLALGKSDLDEKQKQAEITIEQEKLRSTILRTISHDLRTPLTGISGNARTLLDYDSMDTLQKEGIYQSIYDDSIWLIELVENLLSMTRFSHDHSILNLNIEVFEDLVHEAMRHTSNKSHTQSIVLEPYEGFDLVNVDAKLMVQVILNLVDNAIKYSDSDSQIRLEMSATQTEVSLKVIDNGTGIDDVNIANVFDMFYTENKNHGDARRGVGLGLYLCKMIVEAHEGRISCVRVNNETVFEIVLKKEEAQILEN